MSDVEKLVDELRNKGFAREFQHIRPWSEIDQLFNEAADALTSLSAQLAAVTVRAEAAEAEGVRLREALTPSAETKAAYMGEFRFQFGEEFTPNVPWTTIKEIMAAIRAQADLKESDHG